MNKTKTKTQRLLEALDKGQKFTTKQAIRRFGFASQNSFSGVISRLEQNGFYIARGQTATGLTTYHR